ncbi:MAG TPA: histidine phosphatase family protein [Candidatus Eisenbacteria bacterium]|nr:histidine phosphatase family protein [Candidatus Eisenbacteria bacterium]
MIILGFLLLAAMLAPAATPAGGLAPVAPDTAVATVIVVRHAERDTLIGPDHPLTAAGLLRAQELRHVLAHSAIDAIYVTKWSRSRQTAMPIAAALGESLTVVDDVVETVRRLRTRHWGRTALVVGHSNTIPDLIAALTGRPFPEPAVPYDGLWVVTLRRDAPAGLVTLRYGASTEAGIPAPPTRDPTTR